MQLRPKRPLGALEREGGVVIIKRKSEEKNISWDGGGTLSKIVIKLSGTYEKLPCKGEPYRFSGY